jgi:hypothetical protein
LGGISQLSMFDSQRVLTDFKALTGPERANPIINHPINMYISMYDAKKKTHMFQTTMNIPIIDI